MDNISMLKSVIYHSEALTQFDKSALDELTTLSSIRNREFGITGYLFFTSGLFVQYFEGPPKNTDQLLAKISVDRRHKVSLTLVEESTAKRRFASWSMRLISTSGMLSMENLLQGHLGFLGTLPSPHQDSAIVWRMVDTLSELQSRLSETVGE